MIACDVSPVAMFVFLADRTFDHCSGPMYLGTQRPWKWGTGRHLAERVGRKQDWSNIRSFPSGFAQFFFFLKEDWSNTRAFPTRSAQFSFEQIAMCFTGVRAQSVTNILMQSPRNIDQRKGKVF